MHYSTDELFINVMMNTARTIPLFFEFGEKNYHKSDYSVQLLIHKQHADGTM